VGSDASERRSRKAIVDGGEAQGRPPFLVCGSVIRQGGSFRASQLWRALVHPYYLQARVARQSLNSAIK
jgi:hypothetical protein